MHICTYSGKFSVKKVLDQEMSKELLHVKLLFSLQNLVSLIQKSILQNNLKSFNAEICVPPNYSSVYST